MQTNKVAVCTYQNRGAYRNEKRKILLWGYIGCGHEQLTHANWLNKKLNQILHIKNYMIQRKINFEK